MVVRVGQDLGFLENHELTKTTARVRVHIDGLKPLIKEAIVEFDTGEESLITLEYEKLELHCSVCASLLHTRRLCPMRADDERRSPQYSRPSPDERILISTGATTHKDESKDFKEKEKETYHQPNFKARVDRHGNPYDERVSTKQTRVPPPINVTRGRDSDSQNWRANSAQDDTVYSSPQYTQKRQASVRVPQRGKDLFPQKTQEIWRPKLVPAPEDPTNHAQKLRAAAKQSIIIPQQCEEPRVQTMDEVLEDLHQTTRQYLSCSDPVEAAARKQRVMLSDARGDMEKTAATILAGEVSRRQSTFQQNGLDSNPVTPPPLQNYSIHEPLLLEPANSYSPQIREDDDTGLDPHFRDADLTPKKTNGGPAKLKSIIVSPPSPQVEDQQPSQELQQATEKEETLLEFQNKVKRNSTKSKQQGEENPQEAPLQGRKPNPRFQRKTQGLPNSLQTHQFD
ncbi:Uncharacterized protein Rs2_28302 [Raphanus sativus]|nr:Uncharacterized protein Rs2_28302 [Raphanus sativus]